MHTNDLFNTVLVSPVLQGATSLFIVSGYATPAMVYEHFEKIEEVMRAHLHVHLIIGMAATDGIPKAYHTLFKRIASQDYPSNFKCYYLIGKPAVHSKVYAWKDGTQDKFGFVGSANYSLTGFKYQREAIAEHETSELLSYFQSLLPESLDCLDANVEQFIKFNDNSVRRARRISREEQPITVVPRGTSPESLAQKPVILSQLDEHGNVPARSGLNWGQREGRNPNQAYLRVPANIARSGFFPPRGQHFTIITDDGKSFDAVIAQDHDKAIETPKDNSILGCQISPKLHIPSSAKTYNWKLPFVNESRYQN